MREAIFDKISFGNKTNHFGFSWSFYTCFWVSHYGERFNISAASWSFWWTWRNNVINRLTCYTYFDVNTVTLNFIIYYYYLSCMVVQFKINVQWELIFFWLSSISNVWMVKRVNSDRIFFLFPVYKSGTRG